MTDDDRPVGVLIVSHDRAFLRLAAALLWRAGHSVHISGGSWERVERMLSLLGPRVVVLDVDDGLDAEVQAYAAEHGHRVGIVLVADDPEGHLSPDALVLPKWSSPARLIAAVERRGEELARGEEPAASHAEPWLRLVHDDDTA